MLLASIIDYQMEVPTFCNNEKKAFFNKLNKSIRISLTLILLNKTILLKKESQFLSIRTIS